MGIDCHLTLITTLPPYISLNRNKKIIAASPPPPTPCTKAPGCWPEGLGLVGLLLGRWLAGLDRPLHVLVICEGQRRGARLRKRKNHLFSHTSFLQGILTIASPYGELVIPIPTFNLLGVRRLEFEPWPDDTDSSSDTSSACHKLGGRKRATPSSETQRLLLSIR